MQYSLNFNSNLSGFWVYVRDAGGKVTFLLAVAAAMSVDLAASFCDFDFLSSGRSLGANAL